MSSNLLQAQENDENLLELGFVKPVSYLINGVEQIKSIKYMFIESYYSYHIKIGRNCNKIDYYNFDMAVERKTEKIIEGGLDVYIGFGDTNNVDETYYSDAKNGKITIEVDSKLVTAEIAFLEGKYNGSYKIVWENHKLANQVFLKKGEQWNITLDNDEENEWKFNILPNKGFTLIEQSAVAVLELKQLIDNEDVRVRENFATYFEFVAKKVGKYKITFYNGIEQHIHEITVEK